MPEPRTYRIFRDHREKGVTTKTVLKTGLSWKDADELRDALAFTDRLKFPEKTSWRRDVFVVEMEEVHDAGTLHEEHSGSDVSVRAVR